MNESDLSSSPALAQVAAHADFVRRLARALTDADRAEDLGQDVLLASAHFTGDATGFRAWLTAVTRNLARRAQRGERRRRRREIAAARPEAVLPHRSAEALEMIRRITAAVDGLEPLYRSAIVERFYLGTATRDLARKWNVSEAAVRSRVARGLARLRRELDADRPGAAGSVALAAIAGESLRASSTGFWATVVGIVLAMKKLVALALLILVALAGWRSFRPAPDADIPAAPTREETPDGSATARRPSAPHERSTSAPLAVAPSPAVVAPQTGTIRVRVHREDTGRPLEGVRLRLFALEGGAANHERTSAATDAKGEASFRELPAGRYFVSTDRRNGEILTLAAGATVESSLPIRGAVDLMGRVVDGLGRAVPDASIFLTHVADMTGGRIVTTTDSSGAFSLEALDRYSLVIAMKDGFIQSAAAPAGKDDERRRSVTLTLGEKDAAVRGVVRSAAGDPIANAEVLIGDPDDRKPWRIVRTDENGLFEAHSLAAGETKLTARAPGFATSGAEVTLTAGVIAATNLTLSNPVTVRGRITTKDGSPVRQAYVKTDVPDAFRLVLAHSDADGRYTLAGVEPGKIRLRAGAVAGGTAKRTIDAAPGESVEWNVELDEGKVVGGRVVDESGAPCVGAVVSVRTLATTEFRWDESRATDARGEFLIANVPSEAVTLTVHDEPGALPSLVMPKVVTGVRDLELRLRAADRPSSDLSGRLTDADGSPIARATIVLSLIDSPWRRTAVSDDAGDFNLTRLVAGRYELFVRAAGFAHPPRTTLEITPNARRVLEPLRLERTGSAIFRVAASALADFLRTSKITDSHGETVSVPMTPTDDGVIAEPLDPGAYTLSATLVTITVTKTFTVLQNTRTPLNL